MAEAAPAGAAGGAVSLEMLPRVLVVSVNPLSTTSSNGKTIASFFEGYPKAKLAQIFFRREVLNSGVADNYFRVADEDMLLSRLPGQPLGKRVVRADALNEKPALEYLPASLRASITASSFARWLRNLAWSGANLWREPLTSWLDEFSPEVIFFCGGDAVYLYPLVAQISDHYAAPIVMFVTDDYVAADAPSSDRFARSLRSAIRHQFHQMWPRCPLVIAIGDKMAAVYRERFGMNASVAMNTVNSVSPKARVDFGSPVRFVYAGSLHTKRWESLVALGKALDRRVGLGQEAELLVLTASVPPAAKAALRGCRSVRFGNYLPPDELQQTLAASDVLVHVESFDEAARAVTWLSVSTKIPEYFSQGRTVLAIGPADVASLEYIQAEEAGFVATSLADEAIDDVLRQMVSDPAERLRRSLNALAASRRNHDQERTRDWLWAELSQLA